MSEPHRWRSPLLGDPLKLDLPQGRLDAFRRGEGPPLVFAHGWLANANLWRGVVDRLAGDFTCIALDLPLGAHRTPLDPGADLSAAGCGTLIADALDALALDDVTLVGNDSGGAYSQIALSTRPERVSRLVLTSCETPYDEFPPVPFDGLPAAARDPQALGQLLSALEDPEVRKLPVAFGLLVKHPLDPQVSDAYALPCLRDEGVLRDTAKAMAGASTAAVHAAGAALIESWQRPTLFVWSAEDPVFPLGHARRYAAALSSAELIEIDDSYSFTPEDQPAAVAAAISSWGARSRA
ncbi:MAG TPA: alpha/beta hydrolase [Solirubrobacterales bacterium]|nr:alpha/beta hydrolase [Solirubrobacterales bacterium]